MTEADVILWLSKNWPSLLTIGALTKAYLKIREFPARLSRLEARVERVLEVCAAQHPEKGVFLFREKEE